jgi:hypothetical protein
MALILEALMNPGEMTRQQLLLVAIMLFVAIGALYFVWKLYKIIVTSQKSTYVPNIGLNRTETGRSPGAVKSYADTASKPEDSVQTNNNES